jgi:hypothetical protein
LLVIPKECAPWVQKQRPQGDYQKEIAEAFYEMEAFLPETVNTILDIGCGMAGIDVYLKRRYPQAALWLLDGDSDSHHKYGFQRKMVPYNSKEATGLMLKANGVEYDRWIDAGTDEELKADLIVSLISWGFHYPLDTYKVSGLCVAALRNGHEEPRGTVIAVAQKYKRCVFRC